MQVYHEECAVLKEIDADIDTVDIYPTFDFKVTVMKFCIRIEVYLNTISASCRTNLACGSFLAELGPKCDFLEQDF